MSLTEALNFVENRLITQALDTAITHSDKTPYYSLIGAITRSQEERFGTLHIHSSLGTHYFTFLSITEFVDELLLYLFSLILFKSLPNHWLHPIFRILTVWRLLISWSLSTVQSTDLFSFSGEFMGWLATLLSYIVICSYCIFFHHTPAGLFDDLFHDSWPSNQCIQTNRRWFHYAIAQTKFCTLCDSLIMTSIKNRFVFLLFMIFLHTRKWKTVY